MVENCPSGGLSALLSFKLFWGFLSSEQSTAASKETRAGKALLPILKLKQVDRWQCSLEWSFLPTGIVLDSSHEGPSPGQGLGWLPQTILHGRHQAGWLRKNPQRMDQFTPGWCVGATDSAEVLWPLCAP